MASSPVQVNVTLTLPPVALHMPLAADPRLTTTVSPPVAHWGPGPVHVRLISCELREGQVSLHMPGKSLCVFWLRNWVFSGLFFRTAKS